MMATKTRLMLFNVIINDFVYIKLDFFIQYSVRVYRFGVD